MAKQNLLWVKNQIPVVENRIKEIKTELNDKSLSKEERKKINQKLKDAERYVKYIKIIKED